MVKRDDESEGQKDVFFLKKNLKRFSIGLSCTVSRLMMTLVTGRRRRNRRRDIFCARVYPPTFRMPVPLTTLLNENDVPPQPLELFAHWLQAAVDAQLPEPSAMTLATATPDGLPSARMVLLRGFCERGLIFYTNYRSRKAGELDANPQAALVLFWATLHRQIRVEGTVEKISAAESDVYFQSRPRSSRLGAIASPQSEVIAGRHVLDNRLAELLELYAVGEVPRPAHWGGYRVVPAMFEFWQGRDSRLHDRLRYRRRDDGAWLIERLAP
jgi:pyridoxamine 5'-phosphate oxidase